MKKLINFLLRKVDDFKYRGVRLFVRKICERVKVGSVEVRTDDYFYGHDLSSQPMGILVVNDHTLIIDRVKIELNCEEEELLEKSMDDYRRTQRKEMLEAKRKADEFKLKAIESRIKEIEKW